MRNATIAKKMLWTLLAANVGYIAGAQAQDGYAHLAANRTPFNRDAGNNNQSNLPAEKTLFDVLKELNQKKGVYFLFSNPELAKKTITTPVDLNKDVERVLRDVLKSAGLKYKKLSPNTYVITDGKDEKKTSDALPPAMVDQLAAGQPDVSVLKAFAETITGRVTTATGQPVANASVAIKGTSRGTSTNENGVFAIQADKGDIIIISSVGYTSQMITVGEDKDLVVFLEAANQQMNEVVVTALGVKKEARRLGYSTAKVDGDELTKAREINVGNALVGKVAGVNSTAPLTGPGGSSRVTIRGNSSLNVNANNQPLYVINGIPMNNDNLGSAGKWGGADLGDGLSSINPDDIDEMTVLKGGAAAALYGQRGRNGVILITTKSSKGKKALGIEFNSNAMWDKANDFRDFQTTYGQGKYNLKPETANAAMESGLLSWGAKLDGTPSYIFDGSQQPYTYVSGDNYKAFYNTGSTYSNTLALSGGSDNVGFRLSFGDVRNKGIYPNSKYNRNNVNLDLNFKLNEKWSGMANVTYAKEVGQNRTGLSDAPGNGNYAIGFLPPNVNANFLAPGYDERGKEIEFNASEWTTNPYFASAKFENDTRKDRILGVAALRFAPVEWLYFQARIANDFFAFNAHQITPTGTAYKPGGELNNESSNTFNEMNADLLVGFNKEIVKDLTLGITAGANLLRMNGKNIAVNANGLAFPYLYNPTAATSRGATVFEPRREVQSIYGAAELSYRNTFFLNFSDRNDWSSTLPPGNNSYNYPSISGAYIFTEHLKSRILTFGKIRAGFAKVGSDAAPYQTKLYYSTNGAVTSQPIGQMPNSIPNAALEPLQVQELEIGADVKFFNNRLFAEFSWYNKQTLNDIVNGTTSLTSGYADAVVNVGKLENKGVELMVGGTPVKTKNFRWTSTFNYANNKSKIVSLAEGQYFMDMAQSRTEYGYIHQRVGLPYAQVMGFDFKRNAKGDLVLNGSGYPLPADTLVALGTGVQPITGGWSNEFVYKNWALAFLIDFKSGGVIYSGTDAVAYSSGLHKKTLEGREEGIDVSGVDEAGNPKTAHLNAQDYYNQLFKISALQVNDASFIKFRSLSLSYNFPARILKNKVQGLSISLVGRNLFYISRKTDNIDPESNYNNSNAQGLEYAALPSVRSYGLNLNIKF
ncbi:SusC/RagA family TonB-linked outer membrane protein [Flavihumibacter petaseus]|uniref:Putative TonB-dependent receptor n=1 Tax=Flavihumibacter petaseus NBRC 106054 TaxID=1220578 RepID=A0A0E9N210_9BACT|nr:SusC/RagA family TonB-linked outer membrane protein [Flavihumibacter petaseus]GAO43691.1 putative TonB-dependent receptor [Flavihumibacter petaseus NBRC 106054]